MGEGGQLLNARAVKLIAVRARVQYSRRRRAARTRDPSALSRAVLSSRVSMSSAMTPAGALALLLLVGEYHSTCYT